MQIDSVSLCDSISLGFVASVPLPDPLEIVRRHDGSSIMLESNGQQFSARIAG
jgi:hypothetical protein